MAAGPIDNPAASFSFFGVRERNTYSASGSKRSCSSSCALVALNPKHNSLLWDNPRGCFKLGDNDAEVQVKTRIGQNSPGLSKELRGGQLQTRFLLLGPHLQPYSRLPGQCAGTPQSTFRENWPWGARHAVISTRLKPQVPSEGRKPARWRLQDRCGAMERAGRSTRSGSPRSHILFP